MGDDGGLDPDGSGGSGEKWSDSGWILKIELTGLCNSSDVGSEGKEDSSHPGTQEVVST